MTAPLVDQYGHQLCDLCGRPWVPESGSCLPGAWHITHVLRRSVTGRALSTRHEVRPRRPYTPGDYGFAVDPGICGPCGAPTGGYHHPGCPMEDCPVHGPNCDLCHIGDPAE